MYSLGPWLGVCSFNSVSMGQQYTSVQSLTLAEGEREKEKEQEKEGKKEGAKKRKRESEGETEWRAK